MSRKVRLHHFVLAQIVKPQSPTWRASDLFHVSHWIDVPADTEFPYTLPRIHLFARFYLERAKPTDFRVRVWWQDHPSGIPEEIGLFGPYRLPFARNEDVRDCSFNLHNIRLQGVGIHSVELMRESRVSWREDEWIPIARTYFVVER
jgi:hypothetical protein